MKQLFKYPGSKWGLSRWITSFFPEHHSYLEPFFGSGAVLFNKTTAKIETINDLDGEVVNFFECIKRDPERLSYMINFTPYSRDVFEKAHNSLSDDPFERALNFLVRCDMGHGFKTGENVGFKIDIQGRENSYCVNHWNELPAMVQECARRLKQVQIENRPALEVIERFNFPNVLIYADPPYLLETRYGKQYRCEMSEEDHFELLTTLKKHSGHVILSGYHSKLYDEILKDWHVEERAARNQLTKEVTEVLWMNFEPNPQITISDLLEQKNQLCL